MSFRRAAAVWLLLGTAAAPAGTPGPALPETWHGDWVGRLTVYGANGKRFERPWELHVAPVKGGGSLTWRIVSGIGGKQSVRDYELVPEPGKPGQFKIDEKNGIVIDARLMGNALYSCYKDGDVLISVRYERRGESLYVELTSVGLKDPRVSELKADGIEIHSYQVGSVQTGELKRN
jgi:hypothetical protein